MFTNSLVPFLKTKHRDLNTGLVVSRHCVTAIHYYLA